MDPVIQHHCLDDGNIIIVPNCDSEASECFFSVWCISVCFIHFGMSTMIIFLNFTLFLLLFTKYFPMKISLL